jgi:uncharacterized membrane protein YebE (DUF533 family)
MFMLTLFETKKTKVQKSHLKNLIALAKADGIISESELEYLYLIGEKNGLKEQEVTSLINDSKNTDIVVASNDAQRFDHIFELVQMMLSDGVIEDNEMDFCIAMAEKLGFRKAIVGILVRKISLGLSTGLDKEAIKNEAESFLQF